MSVELLIQSIIGLIVLLILLVLLFLLLSRSKKKEQKNKSTVVTKVTKSTKKNSKKESIPSFDELRAIVRNKKSSHEDLKKAVDLIIQHYSKIHPKMGIRSHPDFDKYVDLIVHLVRHRNTSKELILKLDAALLKVNPDYKAELNDTLTKALNSRGI